MTPGLFTQRRKTKGPIEPGPLLRTGTIDAVATPSVSVNSAREAGPLRIAMDVSHQLEQIPFRLHHYGLVTSAEEGPVEPVCAVEALGVLPIHMSYKPRKIPLRSL